MMGKILPVLLAVTGLGLGAGAGILLRPAPEPGHEAATETAAPDHPVEPPEFVKMANQFVVPVVEGGRVSAMVALSLNLETTAGKTEAVYSLEPKLRDAFLQVLFDHANAGGFRGSFTDAANLEILRAALKETAMKTAPELVTNVLIVEIVRQDS